MLSGGGARGAYEVGVVQGLCEALGDRGIDPHIDVFTGTSVGAINGAYLASGEDLALAAAGLAEMWRGLRWSDHLKIRALDTWRWLRGTSKPEATSDELGPSVLDVSKIQQLVWSDVDWPNLHDRIDAGRIEAFVVAALHVGSGRTCLFGEFAPEVVYPPSKDPHRYLVRTHIGAQHVLASAAIPALFPARRIDDDYYCDGGLRFNAPLAPAIRAGADALIVVNVGAQLEGGPVPTTSHVRDYPSPGFMASRVLNALMLDRVPQDLETLRRINDLWAGLRNSLSPEHLAEVQATVVGRRGATYREVSAISFHPSEDPGTIAAGEVRRKEVRRGLGRMERAFVDNVVGEHASAGDLMAYLLFDGGFADSMISLGRNDALARGDELAAIFTGVDASSSGSPPTPTTVEG